jgi:hypothetical protein
MAYFAPSSPILVTMMVEALRSSETSVLTRAIRYNIPEEGVLHSHSFENLKSYIAGLCSRDIMCLLWGMNWVSITQKKAFFIVTAVETSNLRVCCLVINHKGRLQPIQLVIVRE